MMRFFFLLMPLLAVLSILSGCAKSGQLPKADPGLQTDTEKEDDSEESLLTDDKPIELEIPNKPENNQPKKELQEPNELEGNARIKLSEELPPYPNSKKSDYLDDVSSEGSTMKHLVSDDSPAVVFAWYEGQREWIEANNESGNYVLSKSDEKMNETVIISPDGEKSKILITRVKSG